MEMERRRWGEEETGHERRRWVGEEEVGRRGSGREVSVESVFLCTIVHDDAG